MCIRDRITRAQACTMTAKLLGASDSELASAAEKAADSFSDVAKENWFAPYIGYCVNKGIINGYTDKTVRPSQQISLSELAAILCRAAGDSDASLGGTWPLNYLTSAKNRGILEDLEKCDPDTDGEKPLSRGNAAIMTYNYSLNTSGGENPDPAPNPDVYKRQSLSWTCLRNG